MKVLVTGASGFIGNYVVKELLQLGHFVVASSSNPEKAERKNWFGDVTYAPLNLADYDDGVNYFDFFFRPDIMIHLAWEGLPDFKGSFHMNVNLPRHKSFLQNMIRNGLRDLSVTGTCLEYGMREGALSEDDPANPIVSYGIAKNELWKFLSQLQDLYPVSLKWIRLFYIYGEGQTSKSLIPQLEAAIANNEPHFNMSKGDQVRDFLPAHVAAGYIVKTAMQNAFTGIVNCCSGKSVTVKQFILNYLADRNKTISLNTGYYPYPDYEPMRFWGNNDRLKRILNYD